MTYAKDFARDDDLLRVQVKHLHDHLYQVQVGEKHYEVEARSLPDGRLRLQMEGQNHEACGAGDQVRLDSKTWQLEPYQAGHGIGEAASDGLVEAPMTGTVLKLSVSTGADVNAGDTVIVLTAMKMEHKLQAGITGRVTELHVSEGDTVEQGVLLLRIEAEAEAEAEPDA